MTLLIIIAFILLELIILLLYIAIYNQNKLIHKLESNNKDLLYANEKLSNELKSEEESNLLYFTKIKKIEKLFFNTSITYKEIDTYRKKIKAILNETSTHE